MIHYKGVQISSRYDMVSEIGEMRRVIDAFTPMVLKRVQSIWCDSKAGAMYSVSILPGPWDESIAAGIARAFRSGKGFNAIVLTCGKRQVFIDPSWQD
ncbi:hypothetical protein WBP06_04075 [Novosphingobium sp. BL-8H]|uniref:hypothetical protein n=1 Tax=Novosphingobium sp. BL-8H TaxID=3127640 RepID=UPI003756578F